MQLRQALCILFFLTSVVTVLADDSQLPEYFTGKDGRQYPLAGADENTPSVSHYFSWIDNTNEGATEAQSRANITLFKWLHDRYNMKLDVYAWDAGNLDAPQYAGSIYSDRFKSYYPNGWDELKDLAASFDCRLGVWMGPDGFGDTPESEKARHDMLVKLCRDYDFRLFKIDAVCGQLRTEKRQAFIDTILECREHCPDLIVINHRLNLGEGTKYTTTRLWGGEAYIDVWRSNRGAAIHNRAGSLMLGVPTDAQGNLERLVEDHGVCLSSGLDFWEDDLILQAFSRNLLLAPELYGSVCFLRDEEYPKLARIFNLCRKYRDILVNGMILPEEKYGKWAVSRGDATTRIVTMRNTDWMPEVRTITLGQEIGLNTNSLVEVRMLHPYEKILGTFELGDQLSVEVMPFRAAMLIATAKPSQELGVVGCAYDVQCEKPGLPAEIMLRGMPGTAATVTLPPTSRSFKKAILDGEPVDELLRENGSITIKFPGNPLTKAYHRKLVDLKQCDMPSDAESLYEATAYAANNNALEIRSLDRAGKTTIPAVQNARDEFCKQELLVERGVWDRYLFDDDLDTYFRLRSAPIRGGGLRIDFGAPVAIDRIEVRRVEDNLTPDFAEVSADLKTWTKVPVIIETETEPNQHLLQRSYTTTKTWTDIVVQRFDIKIPSDAGPIRYVRIAGQAKNVAEFYGYYHGEKLDRESWRATNLFGICSVAPPRVAWSGSFTLDEAAKGSYIVIPTFGKHGREGVYAALRIGDKLVGAPRRATAYPVNPWEMGATRPVEGLSYFFPITEDMIGKKIDAVLLQFDLWDHNEERQGKIELGQITGEVWVTAYPIPMESKLLRLEDE